MPSWPGSGGAGARARRTPSTGPVSRPRWHRLRTGTETVYLPRFHREIEAAIAGETAVAAAANLLVVEGNYLLLWPEVHELLDEVWYLAPPERERIDGLVARHIEFGRSPAAARKWVERSDEANADLVANGRDQADVIIRATVWPPPG